MNNTVFARDVLYLPVIRYLPSMYFRPLAKHSRVDSIYLDFTNAFDRVNHRAFLRNLSSFGFGRKHGFVPTCLVGNNSLRLTDYVPNRLMSLPVYLGVGIYLQFFFHYSFTVSRE